MFSVESSPTLDLGNVKCVMSIPHVSPRWVPWGMCPLLTVQPGMRDIPTRTLDPIDSKVVWNQQSEMQAQLVLAQIHKIPPRTSLDRIWLYAEASPFPPNLIPKTKWTAIHCARTFDRAFSFFGTNRTLYFWGMATKLVGSELPRIGWQSVLSWGSRRKLLRVRMKTR